MRLKPVRKHNFRCNFKLEQCHALKLRNRFYSTEPHNTESFWEKQAHSISWFKKWDKTLIYSSQSPRATWYKGGLLNICYNSIDRHIANGHGSQKAIIYDSPVANIKATITYDELLDEVSKLAGIFVESANVVKGDRIVIYMPMIPECLMAMQASARIGAVHAVVFGGFSAKQLALRIAHAKPKLIVTSTLAIEGKTRILNYLDIITDALEICKSDYGVEVPTLLIHQRDIEPLKAITDTTSEIEKNLTASFRQLKKGSNLLVWNSLINNAPKLDAVPVDADHPLYILYTSGTTGIPKGVVRTHGGYSVALKWTMHGIYDMSPGECFWASSDFGWVVGHSYSCYGPLLNCNTTVIYEGKPVGTPDASQYFRVALENNVVSWFTTPSALRSIRAYDSELELSKKYLDGMSNGYLRNIFIAGEHCDPETSEWIASKLPTNISLVDHWWQTETGWPITATCIGMLKQKKMSSSNAKTPQIEVAPRGSAGKAVPGWNLKLITLENADEDDAIISNDTTSSNLSEADKEDHEPPLHRIVAELPLPPGFAHTLWQDEQRFNELYFTKYPGYYDTMDAGYMDNNGYLYIMSRVDDIINVASHRLSTSALEEACLHCHDVAECAVIGIPSKLKGQEPLAFVVLKHNHETEDVEQIKKNVANFVRTIVGPVAKLADVCIVSGLPKTRSGKIARASMANMAAGKPVNIPVTIEDASVYKYIHAAMVKCKLNPSKVPKLP